MSDPSAAVARHSGSRMRWIVTIVVVIVVLAAMALDTKVVKIGAVADNGAFSPETFGAAQFPKVQASVDKRAVDAATLYAALAKDKTAAAKQYGVQASMGPEIPVKLTGVAGKGQSGIYPVKVKDIPDDVTIRVQTGPAINGTVLRDATGTIVFGQFKNQIEYQNAGAALNTEMKKEVLSKVDTKSLEGKTISVTGVFLMINPKNWFITPVRLSVQ